MRIIVNYNYCRLRFGFVGEFDVTQRRVDVYIYVSIIFQTKKKKRKEKAGGNWSDRISMSSIWSYVPKETKSEYIVWSRRTYWNLWRFVQQILKQFLNRVYPKSLRPCGSLKFANGKTDRNEFTTVILPRSMAFLCISIIPDAQSMF